MRRNLFFFGLTILLLSGCDKHDPDPYVEPPPPASGIELRVTPLWNGALFDKNTVYHNVMDYRVRVQLIRLYLSDLHLLTSGGEVHLSDAELFSITDGAQSVNIDAPPGSYTGLHFGIGIPEDLNHQDPVQYAGDNPLSVSNGMHWTWADGYRFVIFDGRFDTLSTGTGVPPELFSIHTGMDTCYREREFDALPINVATGAYTVVDITFDLAKFFYTDTDTIDLAIDNQAHGSNIILAGRLSDCIQASVNAQ
ncbi:MAG: MbnP family protein [Flavobacteriales bacterium]